MSLITIITLSALYSLIDKTRLK